MQVIPERLMEEVLLFLTASNVATFEEVSKHCRGYARCKRVQDIHTIRIGQNTNSREVETTLRAHPFAGGIELMLLVNIDDYKQMFGYLALLKGSIRLTILDHADRWLDISGEDYLASSIVSMFTSRVKELHLTYDCNIVKVLHLIRESVEKISYSEISFDYAQVNSSKCRTPRLRVIDDKSDLGVSTKLINTIGVCDLEAMSCSKLKIFHSDTHINWKAIFNLCKFCTSLTIGNVRRIPILTEDDVSHIRKLTNIRDLKIPQLNSDFENVRNLMKAFPNVKSLTLNHNYHADPPIWGTLHSMDLTSVTFRYSVLPADDTLRYVIYSPNLTEFNTIYCDLDVDTLLQINSITKNRLKSAGNGCSNKRRKL